MPRGLLRLVAVAVAVVFMATALVPCASGAQTDDDRAAAGDGTVSPQRYRVEIDAPRALRPVIEANVDLIRWQTFEQMTDELYRRLLDQAPAQVRNALATEGYFSPEVSIEEVPGRTIPVLHIRVQPGDAVKVSSVRVSFAGRIAERPDAIDESLMRSVRDEWTLKTGETYRQTEWDGAKARALATVKSRRYLGARVTTSEARIDTKARTASLVMEIESGPVFHLGEETIRGLSRYGGRVVRALSPVAPGAEYDRDALVTYQRRLVAAGYFASVQIEVSDDRRQAEAAPVRISVIEAPSKRFEVGLGYSTDTLYRLTAAYRDNDFLDREWRLRTDARLETRLQSLGAAIDLPPRESGWQDTVSSLLQRTDIQNLVTQQFTLTAHRRAIEERRQPEFGVTYVLESARPLNAPSETNYATVADYWYTWRATDDLLNPSRGVVAQVRLGLAPPGLSSRAFGRAEARAAWYVPLGASDELLLRGDVGYVAASTAEGIPQAMLFRTGGDVSVRGYAFNSLGVRKGDAIVGGRYLVVASGEYIHWFRQELGGALFVDAGDAFDERDQAKLAVGYGAGLRVRSPIGPIRLDVAYGREVKQVRIHFSVGVTF